MRHVNRDGSGESPATASPGLLTSASKDPATRSPGFRPIVASALALAAALFLIAPAPAQAPPAPKPRTPGVVVCVSPAAAEVGAAVLSRGGNAVDAAVATGFALAVTWPEAGNIGGGGFMLVQPPDGKPRFFDYRETAPKAATVDMFAKEVDYNHPRVAGVPGSVRGMFLAHQQLGKLPWADLVTPAAKLAADGFPMTAGLARSLNGVLANKRTANAEFRRVFGKPAPLAAHSGPRNENSEWQAGDVLKQPDLAKTLRQIAEGPDAFYTGEVAKLTVAEMKATGGLIAADDLAGYAAKERTPVTGTYRGFGVVSAPPPSSGGVALVEMLNTLEPFDLKAKPRRSPETIHLLAEAMRRAYRDRAAFLGDPDFGDVPVTRLTDKTYARKLAPIDPAKATPSASIAGDISLSAGAAPESDETTHYSVLDRDGMAVSTTTTLENSYGCRVVVRGAGFILNNEMTDFNHRPGVTDATGRIGTPPNRVAPGKRPLSSMTPTILTKDGRVALVTGSPGGRTIINTVLCVVVNRVDYGMTAEEAVAAPRQHHAWLPDKLSLEGTPGAEKFAADVGHERLARALRGYGHAVARVAKQGDAHTIAVDAATGEVTAAADKRLDGAVGVAKGK